jgi:flagellar basal body-associated protein FliL
MKKSKRFVILFFVVEALLASIMIFLIWFVKSGALPTTSPEETIRSIQRIIESMTTVMGALGGFLLVFAWVLRRRGE